jgi:outer membrane protein OmpA-like peptidoglycan-associated protein
MVLDSDFKFVLFRSSWSIIVVLTMTMLTSGCNETFAKKESRPESAQVRPTTINLRGLAKELPVILFPAARTSLSTQARKQIREIAQLINHPDLIDLLVTIEGHSDTLGDAHQNLVISKQRAETVTRELVVNGVRSNRLTTNAFGERQPLMTEFTPDGQLDQEAARMNRRVEIFLVGTNGDS